jgi:hypothetical protein
MTKQQIKDAEECERMSEEGKDKECFGCSCSVCIAQESDEIEPFKSRLLENIELIKEDIQNDFDSMDEVYGAMKTIRNVIEIIKIQK